LPTKYKIYSGAGNDFVMINNWERIIPVEKQKSFTADICLNHFPKIDGVIFLDRPQIEGSGASVRMNYYNRDGSFGAMCGNGARCTAQFAIDAGIIKTTDFLLEAVENVYKAEITGSENVRITFPDNTRYKTSIAVDTDEIGTEIKKVHWIYVGSDHIVVFIEDFNKPKVKSVDDLDIQKLGSFLRYYKDFLPAGANVNFVEPVEGDTIRIRTYERGVERETLACGTGIVSSALISSLMIALESPVRVKVQSGEELIVRFIKDGDKFKNVSLEGSARMLEEGKIKN